MKVGMEGVSSASCQACDATIHSPGKRVDVITLKLIIARNPATAQKISSRVPRQARDVQQLGICGVCLR